MATPREQAERILDEVGGWSPSDAATDSSLKAAHVYAMLAVADAIASLQELIADIANDWRRDR